MYNTLRINLSNKLDISLYELDSILQSNNYKFLLLNIHNSYDIKKLLKIHSFLKKYNNINLEIHILTNKITNKLIFTLNYINCRIYMLYNLYNSLNKTIKQKILNIVGLHINLLYSNLNDICLQITELYNKYFIIHGRELSINIIGIDYSSSHLLYKKFLKESLVFYITNQKNKLTLKEYIMYNTIHNIMFAISNMDKYEYIINNNYPYITKDDKNFINFELSEIINIIEEIYDKIK